jgi:hypothetical protein
MQWSGGVGCCGMGWRMLAAQMAAHHMHGVDPTWCSCVGGNGGSAECRRQHVTHVLNSMQDGSSNSPAAVADGKKACRALWQHVIDTGEDGGLAPKPGDQEMRSPPVQRRHTALCTALPLRCVSGRSLTLLPSLLLPLCH